MSRQRGIAESESGWLLALSAAALSISAHGLAGGATTDTAFAALLTALLALGGTSLARRGGLPAVIGVLGVTQASQHLLLTELAGTHIHNQPPVNGWVMLATHTVATLLTAGLLVCAGTALGRAAAALAWLVGRLHALVAGPVPPAATNGGHSTFPARPGQLLEVLFREVCGRRGPPVRS